MATSPAGSVTPASADSAACCMLGSIVIATGCGARPGKRFTVRTTLLPDSITTAAFGVPARRVLVRGLEPAQPDDVADAIRRAQLLQPLGGDLADGTDQLRAEQVARTEHPWLRWKNTPSTGKSFGRSTVR